MHEASYYMLTGVFLTLGALLVAAVGAGWLRRRGAARTHEQWTEPEWCVVLENDCRALHDAKVDYWAAYRCMSERLPLVPEHLRPLVHHQLQLAQLHDKAVASALAQQGLAVETLFGDPEIAAQQLPPVAHWNLGNVPADGGTILPPPPRSAPPPPLHPRLEVLPGGQLLRRTGP